MGLPFETLEYGTIQVQVQVGALSAATMREHLDRQSAVIDEAIAAGAPYQKGVIIVDASVELVPQADVRRMQADWTNEYQDKLSLILHSMGFVVPSALTRGAMTAVMWLVRPPWPMVAHSSLEMAVEWALGQADEIDGAVDERLRVSGAAAVIEDRSALLAS